MTLEEAIEKAREESKNGYVQHVTRISYGEYIVSDWYCEDTVTSFENGKEL